MPKIPIILIFYIYIINMNKEGDNNPSIHNYAEGITAHQTHEKEYTMLTTIITTTSIVTGIAGTTLGIKAAVTDRRQDKTLNTLNESLKKFDDRMKSIEENCCAMAPAVQQLLAIMQSAPQPAPQPAPVAAAPAQAPQSAPQPAPQQAEQPAPQTQQAAPQQAEQPTAAPAAQPQQATKQKAPETQPKTPATKTGANKKNTAKKEVNTNAMPAAVVAAK